MTLKEMQLRATALLAEGYHEDMPVKISFEHHADWVGYIQEFDVVGFDVFAKGVFLDIDAEGDNHVS